MEEIIEQFIDINFTDTDGKEWDFTGLYQVSNLGNVKSLGNEFKKKERILKLKNSSGYNRIGLCKNKKQKFFFVHRLVSLTFIPNPENKEQINHKDGNKLNNNVNNLEWNTQSENQLHRYNILNKKAKKGKDNPSSIKVNQYDLNNNFIKSWDSIMDIQRELNISQGNISSACNGRYKTSGGFKWKFV